MNCFFISRLPKFNAVLKLVSSDGKNNETVDISFDVFKCTNEFFTCFNKLSDINNFTDTNEFTAVINDIFNIIFDGIGTEKIIRFFGGNYLEAAFYVIPFISKEILPYMNKHIKTQKKAYMKKYRFSLLQRLG